MNIRDAFHEAIAGVLARLGRALLVSAGTLAGVAALVSTLGLASTARAQIAEQFNEYTATEVVVTPSPTDDDAAAAIPPDAGALARRVHGVTGAGRFWSIKAGEQVFLSAWSHGIQGQATVYAADPGALGVIGLHLTSGRQFTDQDSLVDTPAILLSLSLAAQLKISMSSQPVFVFFADRPFLVLGIYDDAKRQPETLLGAIISTSTSSEYFGAAAVQETRVIVATAPGSAQVVADQLPVALRTDDPTALQAATQDTAVQLQQSISGSVRRLLLALAAVSMVVGGLSIANGALVSVLERVAEIGLRRALGARRRDIGLQFLIEGAITGSLGGIMGFAIGMFVIVGVSRMNGWTPTLDLPLLTLAPLAGTMTGLLASLYPAARAATIPALEALRHRL